MVAMNVWVWWFCIILYVAVIVYNCVSIYLNERECLFSSVFAILCSAAGVIILSVNTVFSISVGRYYSVNIFGFFSLFALMFFALLLTVPTWVASVETMDADVLDFDVVSFFLGIIIGVSGVILFISALFSIPYCGTVTITAENGEEVFVYDGYYLLGSSDNNKTTIYLLGSSDNNKTTIQYLDEDGCRKKHYFPSTWTVEEMDGYEDYRVSMWTISETWWRYVPETGTESVDSAE